MSSARLFPALCVLWLAPVVYASPAPVVQQPQVASSVSITAQPEVAPVGLGYVEGSSSNPFLFGRGNPVRIMDVFDRAELPPSFQSARPISQINLRADGGNVTALYSRKRNILFTLSVSTSHRTAESTSKVYADFHGRDRVEVFGGRLDVPLQPATTGAPRPLSVAIPFDQTWYYNLTPNRGKAQSPATLVLDYQVHDKVTKGNYVLDQTGFCSSISTSFGLGATCLGSGGKPVTIGADSRAYANNQLAYTVRGVIPTNAVKLSLKIGPLGNPVPISIDPTSGCYINFAPMLFLPGTANSRGQAFFNYPIPRSQTAVGLDIHAQAAGYDINANKGEYTLSLGLTTTVCGPRGVCQLMQLNGGSKALKAQSNVYGLAHVVEFE